MDASLRLRSVQHDKVVSFRTLFFVIPSESEESSMDASLRLRSVQHDKCGVIPNALFCHSERERGIQCDVDASLRLRSVQHDKVVSFRTLFFVIPSESEESSAMWMLHFAYAPFSMTVHLAGE
jgi:hypothetical protein